MQPFYWSNHHDEPHNPLMAFSDRVAALVESAATSVVTVHGSARGTSSGVFCRSGVAVTAEEA